MTATAPARTRWAWLRPLLVVAGVAIAVAGIGGTTGAVIGAAVSPPTAGYHRHHEGHDRFGPGGPGSLPPAPGPH